jgi:hypothetical protein
MIATVVIECLQFLRREGSLFVTIFMCRSKLNWCCEVVSGKMISSFWM